MRITVTAPFATQEFDAVLSFLRWQGKRPEINVNASVFNTTKGRTQVIIKIENGVTLTGFYELVEYWKEKGWIQC